MYCLLREVVKQRTPIKAGCRMKDVMKRYEGEAELILYISPLKTHAGNRIHYITSYVKSLELKSRLVALLCVPFSPVSCPITQALLQTNKNT